MKIDISLSTFWGWVDTQGEIVDVAPHLAATFVLHDGRKVKRERWAISDAESGNNVAEGPTRTEAIARAKVKLASKTQRDVEKAWRMRETSFLYAFGREKG